MMNCYSFSDLSLADKSRIIINPSQEYEESDEDEDYWQYL